MYKCKACGAPASIESEALKRTCDCNTTVVVDMSATARGRGGAQERSGVSAIFAKLHQLGREMMGARIP